MQIREMRLAWPLAAWGLGCVHGVFVAVHGLCLLGGQLGSSCAVQASRRGGFLAKAWALESEVSSGGARACLLHGMRDLGSQISDQGRTPELTGGL